MKKWLENHFVTESSRAELHRLFMQFTTVRAYIVLGEYEKARSLAEKLRKLCTAYHRLLDSAEASCVADHCPLVDGEPRGGIRSAQGDQRDGCSSKGEATQFDMKRNPHGDL
jgi:hypothetical protein